MQSKKGERAAVCTSYPEATSYMLNSIFTLDVRFIVDSLDEAKAIRDNYNETSAKFEAIEQPGGEEYYRVRYSCSYFGSYDYIKVCKILGVDTLAFSVYSI